MLSVSAAEFCCNTSMLVVGFLCGGIAIEFGFVSRYPSPAMLLVYKCLIHDGSPCCCNLSLKEIPQLKTYFCLIFIQYNFFRKNAKVQKRGKINLIGRLQLTTERMREEENEGIVQLRILRTQVSVCQRNVTALFLSVCYRSLLFVDEWNECFLIPLALLLYGSDTLWRAHSVCVCTCSHSQIKLQDGQAVNCLTLLNTVAILLAKGLMPACAYQMRTPCKCYSDTKLVFHKVFTRYVWDHLDFCSENGQVNKHEVLVTNSHSRYKILQIHHWLKLYFLHNLPVFHSVASSPSLWRPFSIYLGLGIVAYT